MEEACLNSFRVFKDKICSYLTKNELLSLETTCIDVCKTAGTEQKQLRPSHLAKFFKILAETCFVSSRKGKENNEKLDEAISCLIDELAENKLISLLQYISCLRYFLEFMMFSDTLKAGKGISGKINKILEKNIAYATVFLILVKSAMRLLINERLVDASEIKNGISQVVLTLLKVLQIPRSTEYKDICIFDADNMKKYDKLLQLGIATVNEIMSVSLCSSGDHNTEDIQKILHSVIKSCAAKLVGLILGNIGSQDSASKSLIKKSQTTLQFIFKSANVKGLDGLLVGEEIINGADDPDKLFMFPNGLMTSLLEEIRERFVKNGWKQDPQLQKALLCATMSTKYPHLKKHIPILVAMLIEMIEDYQTVNQILGIRFMEYVIDNVNPSDLNLHNHGALIHDVLFKKLYGVEDGTLEVLLPCLIKVLYVIEPFPERINTEIMKWDDTVSKLITNIGYESKACTRRLLAKHLSGFILALGINCVKHLKNLLRLTGCNLELHDGPDEELRIESLSILKSCVVTCWPVMPRHIGEVLKIVLKLMVDISIEGSFTSEKAKQSLEVLALEILSLLKGCCGKKQVDVFLTMAMGSIDTKFVDVNDFIQKALDL